MKKSISLSSLAVIMLLSSCNRDSLSENSAQNTSAENSAKGIVTNLTEQDLPNIQLTGSNAAPSQHLTYYFPADAVLQMNKVKITRSALTEYFSVINYSGGYAGLQQTPDKSFGTPNILIASLWDKNTAGGSYAGYSYLGSKTVASRFGGEGDGQKTINPYQWKLNNWYNVVLRSWKENGKIYIANFIQDLATGKWFLTSTIYRDASTGNLGTYIDTFLENWVGDNPKYDGRYVRKAYLKDAWSLDSNNAWQKSTSRNFSANSGDQGRNGYFDRAFNSGYDAGEDAYFMVHGGTTVPDTAFGTGRTLQLPTQTNQGAAPVIQNLERTSATAQYGSNKVTVSWAINDTKAPQLSYNIQVLNSSGAVVQTVQKIKPEQRTEAITTTLAKGNYTVKLTLTDIFNNDTTPVEIPLTVN
ncbi:DUF3472 domain-containing protein [Elizabethkingia occulta]|uniref:Glycosyl hydrolase n=1 Tax=Elizabethkingia occulta TaxID=1867263 RepID=A0A1T3MUR6_9FLAO|nr:DUF3472 domain-containing protein [Elizabethkingia occulta]OPB95235.1 glycosyl hydrolase [Elizabethkingia occulta]OPC68343.1 glycosyl hydrolase [Elizabethkingia occulta]